MKLKLNKFHDNVKTNRNYEMQNKNWNENENKYTTTNIPLIVNFWITRFAVCFAVTYLYYI